MENERILQDSGLDTRWLEAARETLAFGWDLSDQTEYYGQAITNSVILGRIQVEKLRGGVAWANALDKETVEKVEGLTELDGGDLIEALARRIAHHSGRIALRNVGSRHRLTIATTSHQRRTESLREQQIRGLFSIERGDLGLEEI